MLVAKRKHYGPHFADADPEMTVAVDDAAPTRGTLPAHDSQDAPVVIRMELDQVESEHQSISISGFWVNA